MPSTALRYARIWMRAAWVAPSLRVLVVWTVLAMFATVLMTGVGLHPRTLAGMAVQVPTAGLLMLLIYALLIMPAVRELVRLSSGQFLRSVPGPARWMGWLGALVVLAMHAPILLIGLAGAEPVAAVGAALSSSVLLWASAHIALPSTTWRPQAPNTPLGASAWLAWRCMHRQLAAAWPRTLGFVLIAGLMARVMWWQLAPSAAAVLAVLVLLPALVPMWLALQHGRRDAWWLVASTQGDGWRARVGTWLVMGASSQLMLVVMVVLAGIGVGVSAGAQLRWLLEASPLLWGWQAAMLATLSWQVRQVWPPLASLTAALFATGLTVLWALALDDASGWASPLLIVPLLRYRSAA